MVISERKPMEEILGFLKGCEKIVLVGCGQCASACKVGGAPEKEEMTALLEAEGKKVLGHVMPDSTCNLLLNKKELKSVKEELKEADAVLSLACGDGTQTIMKNTKKQNIPFLAPPQAPFTKPLAHIVTGHIPPVHPSSHSPHALQASSNLPTLSTSPINIVLVLLLLQFLLNTL